MTAARLIAALCALPLLVACTAFPALDGADAAVASRQPYPVIRPLDDLLVAAADDTAAAQALAARAQALRTRAAALRAAP